MQVFHDATVRDLEWIINNPPIIQGKVAETSWTDSDFWQQQYHQTRRLLLGLYADPSPLHTKLNKQQDHRLGHRFETLLSYFFNNSSRYQILAQNLQVQDANRTIGEFDFIVQDTILNETQHWEVACKFYLGIGVRSCLNNWHGPMLKDRLDIKFNKMQNKQSQLSSQPAAEPFLQARGIHIDRRICLMKGRLFHPIASAQQQTPIAVSNDHQAGWWAKPDEFISHFEHPDNRWIILNKSQWFASQLFAPNTISYKSHELLDILTSDKPTCVAGFNHNKTGQAETSRGFLVTKNWANKPTINDNDSLTDNDI